MQDFESAILENRGGIVSLRPMGRYLAERDGVLGDAAFQPAPPTGGSTLLVKASDGLRLRAAPNLDAAMVAVFLITPSSSPRRGRAASGSPAMPMVSPVGFRPATSRSGHRCRSSRSPTGISRSGRARHWRKRMSAASRRPKRPSSRRWTTRRPSPSRSGSRARRSTRAPTCGPRSATIASSIPAISDETRRCSPPTPADAPTWGKWIDINLIQQLLTAYDGTMPGAHGRGHHRNGRLGDAARVLLDPEPGRRTRR